ncbi:MAG: UDP-N-acetylmuramate:L-alanyl-gamma-D-glutamyl-meso-diaminopimelate ligase [Pseudomonadota bacterium]
MHIHILGICGTFMGGIAALAKAHGHEVTGCDRNVYPPMSDQLAAMGITPIEGFGAEQIELAPDIFVVGNVVSRGNALMEAILDAGLTYTSGPQWLAAHVLRGRRVVAVAGTHGKTTTTSLVAHLLNHAGQEPGFLVGGVPADFGVSARLGAGAPFVVEADEYDTAFFDKRAKFVHYAPEVAVLNNLEFDHADIYADLAAIEWQFHQLLRIVPGKGRVVFNARDDNLMRVLARGCWTPTMSFDGAGGRDADVALGHAGAGRITATIDGVYHDASWHMPGVHNLQNAAATVAACLALGVPADTVLEGLATFRGVKRRLEVVATGGQVTVFDDFAHHPTAIRLTVDAIREADDGGRLLVAFEPRSNTMKLGVHRDALGPAFTGVDALFVLAPAALDWDLAAALEGGADDVNIQDDVAALHESIMSALRPGDRLVLMSNGGFGGLRERLVASIGAAAA